MRNVCACATAAGAAGVLCAARVAVEEVGPAEADNPPVRAGQSHPDQHAGSHAAQSPDRPQAARAACPDRRCRKRWWPPGLRGGPAWAEASPPCPRALAQAAEAAPGGGERESAHLLLRALE